MIEMRKYTPPPHNLHTVCLAGVLPPSEAGSFAGTPGATRILSHEMRQSVVTASSGHLSDMLARRAVACESMLRADTIKSA
jgi:hypothetical protein